MPTQESAAGRLAFSEFTLDVDRGALLGPDGAVKLRPKSYAVLRHLVEHPGRLVTKDELLDAVWGETVVTDDSLTQCLVEIRRALGDDSHRMVRTVPRRGYLFDTQVEMLGPGVSGQGHTPPVTPEVATPAQPAWAKAVALLAGAALVVALGWWGVAGRDADRASSAPAMSAAVLPNSIAVLPFADMSPMQDQEYFGDGIAEEILNLLAQSPELKVIARTSSFSFKGEPVDIATIAARLGVGHVLEGSVRNSGGQVRVTAQLVSAHDSAHLWSQTYDRELDDVFQVQTEIAAAVAAMLRAKLLPTPSRERGRPHDARAYEHFLRGRFLFNRRNPGDVERAREQFEASLAIDPEYAPAWAALSGVFSVQLDERTVSPQVGIKRRLEAAERALALDADLPEAHLRAAAAYADRDWDRSLQHLRRAEALDPDNPLFLGFSTGRALAAGRVDEAVDLWARIVAIDPLSVVSRFNRASVLMAAGRLDEARAELLAARDLAGGRTPEIDAFLGQVLVLEGRHAEALSLLEGATEGTARDLGLAIAHHALGQAHESAAAMQRLRALDSGTAALAMAKVHTWRGELEDAFAWLALARERFIRDVPIGKIRWAQLAYASPFLNPLHDDPRWAALRAEEGDVAETAVSAMSPLAPLAERVRARRVVRRRRQDRQGEIRLVAGEGLQERDDPAVLLLAEGAAELQTAHDVDGLGERRRLAVVEIRVGELDVAQCRHLEVEAVRILAGHGAAALGRRGALVGLDDAHALERRAAERLAVVAGDAAAVAEQDVAGQLILAERVIVAPEPVVEARVGRDQRLLEGSDRLRHAVHGDAGAAEHPGEGVSIAGDRLEHRHRERVRHRHLDLGLDRPAGLLLEVGRAAVPELRHGEARVQHGGRIHRPRGPLVADRGLEVVGAAARQVVAGVARDDPGHRQARLEEQHLAELDELRVLEARGLDRRDRLVAQRIGRGEAADRERGEDDEHRDLPLHGCSPVFTAGGPAVPGPTMQQLDTLLIV
jgi:TolB-like protein/DNA-binding winged helix-turn-helix (wHTH) protein